MAASAAPRATGRASTASSRRCGRSKATRRCCVQSGKPVGVFRTHADAPRVLIANSNLVPHWATWEHFNELDRKGLMMYGQMTAGSWIYIGSQGIVQGTYETFVEVGRRHYGGNLAGSWILTAGLGGMGGAQPLAATMAGASMLAVECQPSRIEMRLQTGYLDAQATRPRRGAGDHRARVRARSRPVSVGAARQRRRDLPRAGAPRRPARRRHRPDLGARSGQRLSAGRLDAGRMGGAARERSEGGRDGRQAVDGACMCARCSTSGSAACRRSTTATTSARWRRRGRRRRLRLPGLRAGLYPPAVLPRHRAVPLGGAVGRSGGHLPHRRQGEGADARQRAPAQLARHGARSASSSRACRRASAGSGSATAHRLGLAFNEMVAKGELKAPIVIGRDHLDSGSVASPNRETEAMKDGSDAVSDWPLLNALLNCASRRHLGVAPSRRRRRHRLLAARRHGDRLRRHAGGGAAHRARAVERSGDRRHAPRRCRLRGSRSPARGSTG